MTDERGATAGDRTRPVIVECYAGHAYPERPRAFEVGGRRYNVARVEQQWRTPEGVAFRVRTEEGRRFTLEYHEPTGCWSVKPN